MTDKMPFNFLWAGLIHLAFPRAVIIHCRRAAIDTALSIHQTHFHPSLAFPTGGAELVAYFRSYQRLTDHWRSVLPADRFIEVDYEELTRAPEPVDPADHRGLRLGVARRLPAPRTQSAGREDAEQVADPAADLSHLRRALATLRTLAGPAARAPRRRVGTGCAYRHPIVIGLSSPPRRRDSKTTSTKQTPFDRGAARVTIRANKFSPCNENYTRVVITACHSAC